MVKDSRNMNYKPLPDYLTIKDSPIDGQGLFTTKKITANTVIGITHYGTPYYKPLAGAENGFIRTPLGGFGNQSSDPNCEKFLSEHAEAGVSLMWIKAIRDIMPGEEITWKYTLYNIDGGPLLPFGVDSSEDVPLRVLED